MWFSKCNQRDNVAYVSLSTSLSCETADTSWDGHEVRPKNGLGVRCGHLWIIGLSVYSLVMTILVLVTAEVNLWLATPLGSDPNGFVPASVGSPLRWRTFVRNESNPYHIPEDVFADKIRTRETIERLVQTHSSAVRINGRHARWVHDDGSASNLQATFTPPSMGQDQVYFIRGLYQMRCIIVLLEAYGTSIHQPTNITDATSNINANGDREKEDKEDKDIWHWPPEHVAYCLNVLADAVHCTADATPLSFVSGFGSGHLTDGQQAWCRDWDALRAWAADRERAVDTAQGGTALKGAFGKLWRTVLP
ncbi:Putative mycotoxin biosynthesis protein UstYa [Colletotrichum destructivum]|uniref:Mycotoxin biosynthesis protein UstYa n=1 Tax=Colletotrichum destructivum TaxID=34406 RepID=A0AAX4IL24_9PEZI|nr:Putative mycotoxin biosynthesis protein UstYa [Colletotrichum destructivum]